MTHRSLEYTVQTPRFFIDPKALNLNLIRIFLCPIVAKRPVQDQTVAAGDQ